MLRTSFLVMLLATALAPTPVFADNPTETAEESEAAVPAAKGQEASAPEEKNDVASTGARHDAIFARMKELIKKMDAANEKGGEFPSKTIEHALRAEFMRRTEGKHEISWHGRKSLSEADTTMALDNLDLLLTYAERLLSLGKSRKGKKKSESDDKELRMLAAKTVIDQWNSYKSAERNPSSTEGLGPAGRTEKQRRKKLMAGLVAGDEYVGISIKKTDDYGKKYKEALASAAKEYESFAKALAGSGGKKKK